MIFERTMMYSLYTPYSIHFRMVIASNLELNTLDHLDPGENSLQEILSGCYRALIQGLLSFYISSFDHGSYGICTETKGLYTTGYLFGVLATAQIRQAQWTVCELGLSASSSARIILSSGKRARGTTGLKTLGLVDVSMFRASSLQYSLKKRTLRHVGAR